MFFETLNETTASHDQFNNTCSLVICESLSNIILEYFVYDLSKMCLFVPIKTPEKINNMIYGKKNSRN